jgi:hypothetical protein
VHGVLPIDYVPPDAFCCDRSAIFGEFTHISGFCVAILQRPETRPAVTDERWAHASSTPKPAR